MAELPVSSVVVFYDGMAVNFPTPLSMVHVMPHQAPSSYPASSAAGFTAPTPPSKPPTFDIAFLANPPPTSAAAWNNGRLVFVLEDMAWPSAADYAAVVGNSTGGSTSKTGPKNQVGVVTLL
jgi:hypothetical protein